MSHEGGEQPLPILNTSPTVPPTPQLNLKPSLLIDNNNYFGNLPPGYKFVPTDDELIVHYLRKKIQNFQLPRNRITDVKLYEHNPQLLAEKYQHCEDGNNDKRWFFFTPRERKYKNGFRPNRAAGDGYWKATGADKQIKYKGQLVGFRKSLVFYLGKPPRGQKTNWIMHEYRVNDPPKPRIGSQDMKLDDWVLCRVHEKEEKHATRNQQEEGTLVCNTDEDVGEIDNSESNNKLIRSPFRDQHPLLDPYGLHNCPIPSPIFNFGNCNVEEMNPLEFGSYGNFMMANNPPLRPPIWRFNHNGNVHDELLYGGRFDEIDSSTFTSVPSFMSASVPISAVAAFPDDHLVQHTRIAENSDPDPPPTKTENFEK